jgi:DNA-binding protein HU-beta
MADASGCTKACAGKALDGVIASITKAVKKGDKVALVGFGTFSLSKRKARTGRNPQTGATIKIAAKKLPTRLPQRNFRSFQQARLSRTQ